MVRFPEEERESLHTLDDLRINLPNGSTTSLSQVAKITRGLSPPTIVRRDGSRIYTIAASRESKKVDTNTIAGKISPILDDIVSTTPGNSWRYVGTLAETKENKQRIWVTAGLLLFVLFSLLAIPFRSVTQPIFVLLAIPFGAVGAIFGHIVMDITPSFLSFFGLLALTGVVVNDSLVMVDFTNSRRRDGASAYDAVINSGASRFRPILLTSLTTFAGLAYLATEDVKNFFRRLFGMKDAH